LFLDVAQVAQFRKNACQARIPVSLMPATGLVETIIAIGRCYARSCALTDWLAAASNIPTVKSRRLIRSAHPRGRAAWAEWSGSANGRFFRLVSSL
jgi:hypothetical protein